MTQYVPPPPVVEIPDQPATGYTDPAAYTGPGSTMQSPHTNNLRKFGLLIGVVVIAFVLTFIISLVNSSRVVEPPGVDASVPADQWEPMSGGVSDSTEAILENLPMPSAPGELAPDELGFTSFSPTGLSAVCSNPDLAFPTDFTWTSQNAVQAWFGIDTLNAKEAPLQAVDPNGSMTWEFSCANPETTYTVTIADAAGNLVHHSIVAEALD